MTIQKTKNKQSTKYFSENQEEYVANLIGGNWNLSSGCSKFRKGDVIQHDASILIECKTPTSEKDSFSIKKEWIEKNRSEARDMRLFNNAIAFTYGPKQENFFVIDEKLFKFLIEKLKEEYK